MDLEELDERRRVAAQHIEAIQRRRRIIFDKRNKKRALEPGTMVMMQDAWKMDFPGKFDALWARSLRCEGGVPEQFIAIRDH